MVRYLPIKDFLPGEKLIPIIVAAIWISCILIAILEEKKTFEYSGISDQDHLWNSSLALSERKVISE